MAGGTGKGSRKVGRAKRNPSTVAYTAAGRQLKNKLRKLTKHMKKAVNDNQSAAVLKQFKLFNYTKVNNYNYKSKKKTK